MIRKRACEELRQVCITHCGTANDERQSETDGGLEQDETSQNEKIVDVVKDETEDVQEVQNGENGHAVSPDENRRDANDDEQSGSAADRRADSVSEQRSDQSPNPKPENTKAGDERYSELLLMLPTLRSLNKQILVELFFSGLIGNVQIENVIPFILKMDVLQIFGKESLVQMSSSIAGVGANGGSTSALGSSLRSMVASSGAGNGDNGASPLCVETAGMDEDDEEDRASVDDDDRNSP